MIAAVGTDIEDIERFRKKPFDESHRFYERLFSKEEIKYCLKFKDPYPHFAGRFCAKEAMVKAASFMGKFFVTDFQVQKAKDGAPLVALWKNRHSVKKFFLLYCCFVSISHTNNMALAFVTIEVNPEAKNSA
ncbi:MAG: holo-ACP synthase [Bdellovibrionales bacterium]|nr:holo-ACP synthase [Bdellovibrionales bacterium]